jgi:pimeloyl-ACP methyl ester carboxylesterase
MEKQFVFNGSQINYTLAGSGKCVMLVHGFGEDSSVWENQTTVLQQHFQLIVPDLPGSGKSSILKSEDVTINNYTTALSELLKAENIDECVVLGHSMGGYITLAFAEMFPDKLKGFGFIHSTAFADSEEKKDTRRKGIRFIQEHGSYPFLKNSTPSLFSEAFKKDRPEAVEALIEKGKYFSKEALIQYYNAMINRPERTDILRNSNVPVLFVIGTEDTAAPLEDLLKQVNLPAVSYIHIIEGVGHMSMLEKPGEVNDYISAFLNDCFRAR